MIKFLGLVFIFFQTSYSQKQFKIKLKKYRISFLSDTLRENSGLIFLNQKLYTFNDGGNSNSFYEIDPANGKIIKIFSTKVSNYDWEAITTNEEDIFIGDFGNNLGERKNLIINQFEIQNDATKLITSIPFEYKNQTDFTTKPLNNNFDCEAMLFDCNKLHLFTKEWKSKTTSHYILETNSNFKQKITPIEIIKTKFITTDATFYNNQLYLIGYTKSGRCFLQVFEKEPLSNLFLEKCKIKIRLGSVLSVGQIEGVAVNQKGIYISAEGFKKFIFHLKPSLYFIPFKELSNFAP